MGKLLDLDAILPEDLEVKIGGQVYKVPGDLDVETVARLNALTEKLASGENIEKAGKELAEALRNILSLRQEVGEIKLTFAQALALLQAIIQNANDTVKQSLPFSSGLQSSPLPSTGRTRK